MEQISSRRNFWNMLFNHCLQEFYHPFGLGRDKMVQGCRSFHCKSDQGSPKKEFAKILVADIRGENWHFRNFAEPASCLKTNEASGFPLLHETVREKMIR